MKKRFFSGIILMAAVFLLFLNRLEAGHSAEGLRRLEDSVRRCAVSCYASEGFYPPNIAYMEENWGLRYEKDRYLIRYEVFSSNLMPQITVLEK